MLMNCECEQSSCQAYAGATVYLMARLVYSDGTPATIANTASVRIDVYDVSPTRIVINSLGIEVTDGTAYEVPAVEDVITMSDETYDDYTKDSRWTADSIGYNVSYSFTPLTMDKTYEVRIKVVGDNGSTAVIAYTVNSR